MNDAHLNCSQEPLRELRHAVLKKYGKIYSVLEKEINIAISERAGKILEEKNKKSISIGE